MKRAGKGPLTWFVHLVYAVWSLWNRILFPPKIKYLSPAAKQAMKQPCILIANHTAHTDGYYLPQMLPGKLPYTYVTRKWYDKPGLHWMFSRLPYIPVNLQEMDTTWLGAGAEVLKRGGRVILFPEGKLVTDGSLGEFHPGFLMLAKQTGAPVIPIALCGGYRKFRRKTLLVGMPLELKLNESGRPSVILRREAAVCRTALTRMLDMREAPAVSESKSDRAYPAEGGREAEAGAEVALQTGGGGSDTAEKNPAVTLSAREADEAAELLSPVH